VPRAARHNQITIFLGIDFGVELVTSDAYFATLEGMRGRVSVFKQCIQYLAIPAAALFGVGGFAGLLSWLLTLLVSRVFTLLWRLRSNWSCRTVDRLSTTRPEWPHKKVLLLP